MVASERSPFGLSPEWLTATFSGTLRIFDQETGSKELAWLSR
ncbi:hypothetical protein ACQP1K_03155 [Sphaerimonospora sp. CA-214678]